MTDEPGNTPSRNTTLAGPSDFPTTQWTLIIAAGNRGSREARSALVSLCERYWYPLYAYVRRQGQAAADAEDLVQAFFARLLERKYLRVADRSRGRFRTFLLTALQHFIINEWQKQNRQKRGGSVTIVSLDTELAESRFASEPAVEQAPDTLYDRGWASVLMQRAMEALRAECEQSGKLRMFERLKVFLWGDKNALPYSVMAGELGMNEGALKVAMHRLKQRYGELLRGEIAQTVATPVEVEEELRYLASVIRDSLK
jgi:RNA polymerase sigma-70 factor (ECF subfamily)